MLELAVERDEAAILFLEVSRRSVMRCSMKCSPSVATDHPAAPVGRGGLISIRDQVDERSEREGKDQAHVGDRTAQAFAIGQRQQCANGIERHDSE